MRLLQLMVLIGLVLVVSTFAIINATPVTIHYYFGARTIALSYGLLIAFVAGVLIGVLSMSGYAIRLHRRLWYAKRQQDVTILDEVANTLDANTAPLGQLHKD